MTPAGGDDYTYENAPGGPVFNPAGQPDAEPGTDAAWAERWQAQGQRAAGQTLEALAQLRGGGPPDLRTLAEREADDVAQLRLRCDNLVDAVEAAHRRIAALEATVATLVKVLEVRL